MAELWTRIVHKTRESRGKRQGSSPRTACTWHEHPVKQTSTPGEWQMAQYGPSSGSSPPLLLSTMGSTCCWAIIVLLLTVTDKRQSCCFGVWCFLFLFFEGKRSSTGEECSTVWYVYGTIVGDDAKVLPRDYRYGIQKQLLLLRHEHFSKNIILRSCICLSVYWIAIHVSMASMDISITEYRWAEYSRRVFLHNTCSIEGEVQCLSWMNHHLDMRWES